MKMQIDHHPCFNRDSSHKYGRIHLPVAPSCNIQCNYCNRKFDCVNESRPGVCSFLLSPDQASEYVEKMIEKRPEIKVIGIAGPGDPFAEPEQTLKTLELIRTKFRSLLLCVSTNGLNVAPYISELEKLNVTHLTITLNTLKASTGAKIYSWVRYRKKVYRKEEGAKLLIENQLTALEKISRTGIQLKINTIYLPKINEQEIPDLAKSLTRYPIKLFNCIPYYRVKQTPFENLEEPSHETLNAIRYQVKPYLPVMSHCQRCRADAAGLLGESGAPLKEFLEIIQAKENKKRPYIAVGTREGVLVNLHLGEASRFFIYEKKDGAVKLLETRDAPEPGGGELRWNALAGLLADCQAVLVSGAGDRPIDFLKEKGVKVIIVEGLLEEMAEALFAGKGEEYFKTRTPVTFSCKGGRSKAMCS